MSHASQAIRSFTQRAHAPLRLICFPYSGGSAQIYKDWGSQLPSTIDVCGVQLPGRAGRFREARYSSIDQAVKDLLPDFLALTQVPFALFGHSLGAALAFEMGVALEAVGRKPRLVVTSGMMGPRKPSLEPPIYHLPDDEFRAKVKEYNGTPQEILEHEELMDLILPLLKSDFTMADTYHYVEGRILTAPIACFAGLEDPHTNPEGVSDWQNYTRGSFTDHFFPGDHFFIHHHEAQLLTTLAQCLAKVM